MTPLEGINKVLAKAGGVTAVARILGAPVKRQNVEYWAKVGEMPAEHCPALELALGIPCDRIRPDLTWVRVPCDGWPKGKPLLDLVGHEAVRA